MASSNRTTASILSSILLAAPCTAWAATPQGGEGKDAKNVHAAVVTRTPLQQAQDVARKEPAPLTPRQEAENRAALLTARKQYAEACAIYLELLKQEPRSAYLLNRVGVSYHQQAMLGMAKRYYDRAVKADSNYASARNNLGTVFYQRTKYKRAAEAFQKAIVIDPMLVTAHFNLANANFQLKKYDEALASFQRALELDPEIFERRSGSAGGLLQNSPTADRAGYFFFLAKLFAGIGDAERCAKYLRKARDEGYKDMASVAKDPAFSKVINDPLVQEILQPNVPMAQAPKP